jgi:hypothetical protein
MCEWCIRGSAEKNKNEKSQIKETERKEKAPLKLK